MLVLLERIKYWREMNLALETVYQSRYAVTESSLYNRGSNCKIRVS